MFKPAHFSSHHFKPKTFIGSIIVFVSGWKEHKTIRLVINRVASFRLGI